MCLADLAQGTVCKILDAGEVKPHKVRYYLERRDPEFAEKMAKVLCVYREVKLLKKRTKSADAVAIVSYDEKPGVQAIGATAPDLPPVPGSTPERTIDGGMATEAPVAYIVVSGPATRCRSTARRGCSSTSKRGVLRPPSSVCVSPHP